GVGSTRTPRFRPLPFVPLRIGSLPLASLRRSAQGVFGSRHPQKSASDDETAKLPAANPKGTWSRGVRTTAGPRVPGPTNLEGASGVVYRTRFRAEACPPDSGVRFPRLPCAMVPEGPPSQHVDPCR